MIKSAYGEGFDCPVAPYFRDVPANHTYFKYIQKMRERGFTHVSSVYMPDGIMSRTDLAAFISEAFLGIEHQQTPAIRCI